MSSHSSGTLNPRVTYLLTVCLAPTCTLFYANTAPGGFSWYIIVGRNDHVWHQDLMASVFEWSGDENTSTAINNDL